MTPAIERGKCERCEAPVGILTLKDDSTAVIDIYPSRNVFVLNSEGKGMRAKIVYFPHACRRGR